MRQLGNLPNYLRTPMPPLPPGPAKFTWVTAAPFHLPLISSEIELCMCFIRGSHDWRHVTAAGPNKHYHLQSAKFHSQETLAHLCCKSLKSSYKFSERGKVAVREVNVQYLQRVFDHLHIVALCWWKVLCTDRWMAVGCPRAEQKRKCVWPSRATLVKPDEMALLYVQLSFSPHPHNV